MQGNRSLFIVVGAVAAVVLGWWLFGRSSSAGAVQLIDQFAAAGKRPDPGLFAVEDVTINGDTRRAIAVTPSVGTRLTFKTLVPDDGWLRVAVGLKEEAWTQEGDGVRFMAIVSDGRASDELFVHDANPFLNPTERKWIPLMVDLSAYAGEEVDIMLNTYASAPGKGADVRNDLAVWGAPEIVVR